MELKWMGRNRRVVKELARHSNIVNRALSNVSAFGESTNMTCVELQILESLIEHDDENRIMSEIAYDVGIPRSAMTLSSKHLIEQGLIEKYRLANNNKSIILRPTKLGRKVYQKYSETAAPELFNPFFDELNELSDEELDRMAHLIKVLNDSLCHDSSDKLIKFEEN
jgi:DNA-binding MarR family transcriptional regulator